MAPDEIVTLVDRANRVTGSATRSEMRSRRLTHRAAFILVFSSAGELLVQKRTLTKDVYPGFHDAAAGGVVLANESYETAARRELQEELGIQVVFLLSHGDCFFEDDFCSVWGRVYSCAYDGAFTFQSEEVENGNFWPITEVLQRAQVERFTPDSMEALKQYLRSTSSNLQV
jgi:isopentenyldiphosphate isomerase